MGKLPCGPFRPELSPYEGGDVSIPSPIHFSSHPNENFTIDIKLLLFCWYLANFSPRFECGQCTDLLRKKNRRHGWHPLVVDLIYDLSVLSEVTISRRFHRVEGAFNPNLRSRMFQQRRGHALLIFIIPLSPYTSSRSDIKVQMRCR